MSTPRLPLLPRVGFALLTVALTLTLVVCVLLFFVLPDERWSFALPVFGMLFGLSWVRGARRTWIAKHRTATPGTPAAATVAEQSAS